MAYIPKPIDAIQFLKRKKIVPIELWSDISGQEHTHAFTASHILEADCLNTILGLIVESKEKGTGLEVFKTEMLQTMTNKGWYLNPDKIDDEKYTDWRLGVIYNTNSRIASSAGRYRQQSRTSQTRPYLLYKQVQRATKRTEHEPLHNVCKPFDDPFWNKYYPPNGWNCDCEARSLTKQQALNGLSSGQYNGSPPPDFNPAKDVPEEWTHNPGKEMLSPDFSKYANLKNLQTSDGKNALKEIKKAYTDEILQFKTAGAEFQKIADSLIANKTHDQGFIYYASNIDEHIAEEINKTVAVQDTKLCYSQMRIRHATRPTKKAPIAQTLWGKLPTLNARPDLVYLQKSDGNIIFFNHDPTDKNYFIKTAFSNKKGCSLMMDTTERVTKTTAESMSTDDRFLMIFEGKKS